MTLRKFLHEAKQKVLAYSPIWRPVEAGLESAQRVVSMVLDKLEVEKMHRGRAEAELTRMRSQVQDVRDLIDRDRAVEPAFKGTLDLYIRLLDKALDAPVSSRTGTRTPPAKALARWY